MPVISPGGEHVGPRSRKLTFNSTEPDANCCTAASRLRARCGPSWPAHLAQPKDGCFEFIASSHASLVLQQLPWRWVTSFTPCPSKYLE